MAITANFQNFENSQNEYTMVMVSSMHNTAVKKLTRKSVDRVKLVDQSKMFRINEKEAVFRKLLKIDFTIPKNNFITYQGTN